MLSQSRFLAASDLSNYVSIPAVLVTVATVTQNTPFSLLTVTMAIAGTHYT